jgi:O-antigen ligase
MIELTYSLFLLSGLIKFFVVYLIGDIWYIDFTLLCAAALLLAYLLHFTRNALANTFHIISSAKAIVFTLMTFYLWIILSLIYTRSPEYCYLKTLRFLTLLIALVFPFVYRGFKPDRFFKYFLYTGSGLVFVYAALMPKFYAGYVSRYENRDFVIKYLDIGYLAGIMILLLIFACRNMKPVIRLGLMLISFIALVISAARGPILFLALVLFIRLAIIVIKLLKQKWRFSPRNILYLAGGVGGFAAAIYYLTDKYAIMLERTFKRLMLVFDPLSGSVAKRFDQIYFTLGTIFESVYSFFFGLGIGSFGIVYDGVDERQYPHNVILEIWFELGIIGVTLFAILLLLYFKKIRLNLNFLLIFIFLFLNSMKSYSLVDSRVMFGILSILILTQHKERLKGT